MTATIPSVATLKSRLWSYLNARTEITSAATISPTHPTATGDLTSTKGRIVISQLYDTLEGTIVTRSLLAPTLQLACWGTSEPFATQLLERVVNALEQWTPASFAMSGQKLETIRRSRRTGPLFDSKVSLFVSSVDVTFKISTLI